MKAVYFSAIATQSYFLEIFYGEPQRYAETLASISKYICQFCITTGSLITNSRTKSYNLLLRCEIQVTDIQSQYISESRFSGKTMHGNIFVYTNWRKSSNLSNFFNSSRKKKKNLKGKLFSIVLTDFLSQIISSNNWKSIWWKLGC